MEGLPLVERRKPKPTALLASIYPGLLAAITIALAATWLSQHYSAPVMLFALLFGMAFQFLHEGRCVAGIEFAAKAVLRTGVALLGLRITTEQILSLGWAPIVLVIAGVASTLLVGAVITRILGLSRAFGLVSGGSVGICGASAALAIASVLPASRESERDVVLTVVVVTALSTVAMVLYPMLVAQLGMDHRDAGIFLGGTIHDVAQVVGAGYMISEEAGDVATYVKLLRVAMLLPVVFFIAVIVARGDSNGAGALPPTPLFLVAFAILIALNSFEAVPRSVTGAASDLSRWCLVVAISALGMKTSFKSIIAAGWRPVAAIVTETLWIAAVVLLAIYSFG